MKILIQIAILLVLLGVFSALYLAIINYFYAKDEPNDEESNSNGDQSN